jgi:hypothetical protein
MTRDDIIRMAREAQMPYYYRTGEVTNLEQLERFAALVAAAEREACAKVCDGLADIHEKMNQWGQHKTAETLAQAIRARGQA